MAGDGRLATLLICAAVVGSGLALPAGWSVGAAVFGIVAIAMVSPAPLTGALAVACAYLAALSVHQARSGRRRAERLLQETQARQAAEAGQAVLEERARIAREVHDVVAHALSALSLHLEATRRVMRTGQVDAALELLESARELAQEGVEESRRAVDALRAGGPPLDEALEALVERVASASRSAATPECVLSIDGTLGPLRPAVSLAAYRAVQEAVTNALRHAPGSVIDVRVLRDEAALVVEVISRGGERQASKPGAGHGLAGLRERAAELRGELDAGPIPEGFECAWCFPLERLEHPHRG